jgi:cytochrome P450
MSYFRNKETRNFPPTSGDFPLAYIWGGLDTILNKRRGLQLSEKLGGIYKERNFLSNSVVVSDPALAREALRHYEAFSITPFMMNDVGILLSAAEQLFAADDGKLESTGKGENLITSPVGEVWKKRRKHFDTTLSLEKVENAIPAVLEMVEEQMAGWRTGDVVDLEHEFSQITSKTMALLLFNDADGMTEDEFAEIHAGLKDSLNFMKLRLGLGTKKPPKDSFLLTKTGQYQNFLRAANRIAQAVKKVLDRHSKIVEDGGHSPFLEDGLALGLSMPEIQSQLSAAMQAGFETTQTYLHWVWVYLTGHSEWYSLIAKEVHEVFPEGEIDPKKFGELKVLDAFIKEVGRLEPPVSSIARTAVVDTKLGNYDIEAGQLVLIDLLAMHRSSRHWTDAETFNPNRWVDGKNGDDHTARMPFSKFEKGCPGMLLALMELKAVLVKMILKNVFLNVLSDDEKSLYEANVGVTRQPKRNEAVVGRLS